MKGQLSEAELHFIRARLRGGIISKARRGELITPLPVGLAYDAAGHVILDPDTAVQGALRAPVHHLRGDRVGLCLREGVQHRRAGLPLAAPRRAPQGELDWKPLQHHIVLRVLHNPRYAGAFTFGRRREQQTARRQDNHHHAGPR